MSDFFGIGQAIKGAAFIYFASARRTGRTTSLVESLHDGDRVVFTNSREADRVKRMCKDRGVKITTVVIDPKEPTRLLEYGYSHSGRTVLDHTWVEQYYSNSLENTFKELTNFQREMSSDRNSTRKEIEISKWPML
jgi:hypothetical protein